MDCMKNLAPTLRLAAASLLILTACASARQQAPSPNSPTLGLWQQIQATNSDLSCDSDTQCHTIAVGAKACGGPESYLAWSSKHTDSSQLKALVEKHAAAQRDDNNRNGMMSTCRAISDPGASCRAGLCVLSEPDIPPPPGK